MGRIIAAIVFLVIAVFAASIEAHLVWENAVSLQLSISVAAVLTSALGVLFLSLQTFHQTRVSQAQIIQALSQDSDQNVLVEIELDRGGALYEYQNVISREQLAGLISFLTFFERINTFVELELTSMKIFDELYGYRFFLLTHNLNVQRHILLNPDMKEAWRAIFKLHKRWLRFRRKRRINIPWEDRVTSFECGALYKTS